MEREAAAYLASQRQLVQWYEEHIAWQHARNYELQRQLAECQAEVMALYGWREAA